MNPTDNTAQKQREQQVASFPTTSMRATHSLPQLNLNGGRQAILEYFENTWSLTETLFSALVSDEAYLIRPWHKTRHPLIFYYAHPVCFYVNKLLVSGLIDEPVNQDLELLFETGVDEMTWDDLHEGAQDVWPDLDDVRGYRQQVFELVTNLIKSHPIFEEPVTQDKPSWALVMAFEHERIHLETSSVLMRELPLEFLQTPAGWPEFKSPAKETTRNPVVGEDYAKNPMLDCEGRTVTLGKPEQWPSFGWDNEYGTDKRKLSDFKASKFLVSNGEFYKFVSAGGYEDPRYWSEAGWSWRTFRNTKWPTFWLQDGPAGSHRYRLRTTFTEIPMQWDWPAIVNYFEAKAYCSWLSEKESTATPYRVLHEAEHIALREPAQQQARAQFEMSGSVSADSVMQANSASLNHNLCYGGESPVTAGPPNSRGFHDVFGNVWQWCEDTFHPLPEFSIHPYYTDFSTPCFDNEHQMILGGSFISTGDEASIWSRFHFRPHFFQHAGFRLARDISSGADQATKYETDALVNQYLLFHWGSHSEQRDEALSTKFDFPDVQNLITRTVELMIENSSCFNKALDLGCAVGRSSFELARRFKAVTGLDYSQGFIDAAAQLAKAGSLDYWRTETGRHRSQLTARVAEDIDTSRLQFIQGDAMHLAATVVPEEGPFDAILLSNLLCRLSDPASCLRQFVGDSPYLDTGGILVIASPNTWMNQFTAADNFLDGKNSEETLAALGRQLPGFELIHDEDLPFMIREHRRKYEYIVSQVSVWRKT